MQHSPGVFPETPTVIAPSSRITSTSTSAVGVSSSTLSILSFTSSTAASQPSTFVTSTSTSTYSLTSTLGSESSTFVTSPSSSEGTSSTMSLSSNILVIAADTYDAGVATSGLNGYGIPFTTLLVPQSGVTLPALNSSSGGNFGGIVIVSEVSYDYGNTTGYQSALTTDQWNQLYAYQLEYGVRMVQYDVYPGPNYGATVVGDGCCATGVEQLISFSDISDFPTSGLNTGAGVSTEGLWHYPAVISDPTTTKEIAQFAANSVTSNLTTAAVINNFSGREQMAFFTSFDTTWSATSSYLQHAWISWITRGLYSGYRRVHLNTQVDDMFLESDIYLPNGTTFRISTEDLDGISAWVPTVNAKLNPGSTYFVEVGFNGNGNIEQAADEKKGNSLCNGGGIEYADQIDTPLEFEKPLGSGTSIWPASPTSYNWTESCAVLDPLWVWWQNSTNRDQYGLISHTFTHEDQDNATYSDVTKEISWNQAWLAQIGFTSAKIFTSNGIIPPAITGLHNGDALQAWWDNGITQCVGDNTRPVLMNPDNAMWPYFTNVAADGFAGMQVNGRWATRIYYNCDTPDCTTQEWIDTSAGSGTFYDLLDTEMADTMRHLFGLYHDAYMFHQANLHNTNVTEITINGVTAKYSLFQAWVETQVQEFVRLADWPIVTINQADMSTEFLNRYTRDQCGYALSYEVSNQQITSVTLTANGNTCSVPIPVTFPVAPTSTLGYTTEQLGSDPLTVWVQLSGSPVTFTLSTPIAL